jgi:hypothetical protein
MYLGALCDYDGWISILHRGDRCDLSLFQLGLRLLEHLLKGVFTGSGTGPSRTRPQSVR